MSIRPAASFRLAASLHVALALAALPSAARADEIVLVDGRTLTGVKIVDESYQAIRYRKAGVATPQEVASAEVADVRYERASKSYREAMVARDEGNLTTSINLLLTAAEDGAYGEHQQARALVEAAEAMLNLAEYPSAVQRFDELLREHPKTRHLGRALLGKGRAALLQGDFATASSAFDALVEEAGSKNLGERWKLEAGFFSLLTAEARGDKGLVGKYEALRERTAGKFTTIANKCALRIGRLRLAEGKPEAAKALFAEILASRLDSEREIVAGAYNGRGRALFELAGAASGETRTDLFKQALIDFLRVYVHYTDVRVEQPEALYFGAMCFDNLAASVPDADFNKRRLLYICKTEFPATVWGKRAAES